jgi:cytochrome c oxidase accessory protein FixG
MSTSHAATPNPALPKVAIPGSRYHRVRKTVQTICVLIFILLPLFDIMRVDIPRQRFYFFGVELWISEFAILFLTMMFLWILIAAMAMIYGRFWCGYLCPQMIFSEAANSIEKWITRRVNRTFPKSSDKSRWWITKVAVYILGIPPSTFVAFVFVAYFVLPIDLFHRLMSFDIRTAAGIIGAAVTAIAFFDFAFLRQRFCTAICPYGYLQSMLADKHTLLVHFHDPNHMCINCAKCVRECPMGIDIRKSSHQLECTHCAECVDACSNILGKINRQTVIQYGWGDDASNFVEEHSWYRRIGLRDGKRIVILVLLLVYATGLFITIGLRKPVLVRIFPNRSELYTVAADGQIHNHFRLLASNRGPTPATVTLSVSGLPSGSISGLDQSILLSPGDSIQHQFDIASPVSGVVLGINHITLHAQVTPTQPPLSFDENFIAPFEAAAKPQAKP